MARRTTEDRIKDLEAQIAAIKNKAEQKRERAVSTIKLMKAARKALERAIGASEDMVLRQQLVGARETVSACLALCGVAARRSSTLTPRARRTKSTENGVSEVDAGTVVDYLEKNPASRSEQITAALGTDAATLRP